MHCCAAVRTPSKCPAIPNRAERRAAESFPALGSVEQSRGLGNLRSGEVMGHAPHQVGDITHASFLLIIIALTAPIPSDAVSCP